MTFIILARVDTNCGLNDGGRHVCTAVSPWRSGYFGYKFACIFPSS
jgi:hypothetical protein